MIDREDICIIETMARSDASNEALGRVVRIITTGSPAPKPAQAPAPMPTTAQTPTPAPQGDFRAPSEHNRYSDADRYLDGPVRAALYAQLAVKGARPRIVGTVREIIAKIPWPYSETTPSAGRSLGSKLGWMVARRMATQGGVCVVSTQVLAPHGVKSAVLYTLGLVSEL